MDYLTEDIELLDIPDFQPKYDDGTEYGYKNKPGRNLEKLLRETSKNHCMYCYALLEMIECKLAIWSIALRKN